MPEARCHSCTALRDLTSAQQVIAHHMPEKDLSQAVFDLARTYGWLAARYPTWRKTGTTPGVPDLVLVKPGEEVLFVELKRQHGKLTAPQKDWQDALAWLEESTEGRVMHLVWRPSHLLSGLIEGALMPESAT